MILKNSRFGGTPRFFLMAVLALGSILTPLAPAGFAAQVESTAAPKHAAEKPVTPFKQAHESEKAEEADETAAYRHSATVQWLAKVLHLDVETAATLFEYINFGVIALAIGGWLWKTLPKKMRERSETLSQELQSARTATADANTRLSAVEAKLAGLDAEIGAIRAQVEQDMRDDEVRVKASIGEESARIVAAAEQEIAVAAAQARRGLKQYAAELAIDGALSRLSLTAQNDSQLDRALIAEFAAGNSGKAGRN